MINYLFGWITTEYCHMTFLKAIPMAVEAFIGARISLYVYLTLSIKLKKWRRK